MNEPDAGRRTVLVVDDDDEVRAIAVQIVRTLDFRVIEANGGEAALEILRGPTQVDLLFTDIVMPNLSGLELALLAKQVRPDLKVIYTSAYAFGGAESPALRYGPLIPKPWKLRQLRDLIGAQIHTGEQS